jgi:hypothetical protein
MKVNYQVYQPGKRVKLQTTGGGDTSRMIQLQNDRVVTENNYFGVFSDADIGMPLGMEDQIIESVADEDIDTDDEILFAGRRTCHADLGPLARRIEMPNYQLTIKNMQIKGKISATEARANGIML